MQKRGLLVVDVNTEQRENKGTYCTKILPLSFISVVIGHSFSHFHLLNCNN